MSRTANNGSNVRAELLDAAIDLLRSKGTTGATARAICSRVGVGPPALYHHYGNLERLHHAAVAAAFEQVVACYEPAARAGGPLRSLRTSWSMLMRFTRENPKMFGLVNQQVVQGKMPAGTRRAFHQLVSDLTELSTTEELRYDPLTMAKILWSGGMGAAGFIAGESLAGRDEPALAEAMLETLLASLVTGKTMPSGMDG